MTTISDGNIYQTTEPNSTLIRIFPGFRTAYKHPICSILLLDYSNPTGAWQAAQLIEGLSGMHRALGSSCNAKINGGICL